MAKVHTTIFFRKNICVIKKILPYLLKKHFKKRTSGYYTTNVSLAFNMFNVSNSYSNYIKLILNRSVGRGRTSIFSLANLASQRKICRCELKHVAKSHWQICMAKISEHG